ncbi:DUF2637 domain-containing protein [Streptomyces sp. NPDC051018]|uniref:DUF2637 domain-containing protein n=1 Tax=Streptomyces sp. NPDC051018 TaxID=3365639 RepID=UPI0037A81A97
MYDGHDRRPYDGPDLHPDDTAAWTAPGNGRHRSVIPQQCPPLGPFDTAWDPAEELAFLLQEATAAQAERTAAAQAPRRGESDPPDPGEDPWTDTVRLPEEPPYRRAPRPRRRKPRVRRKPFTWLQTASFFIAALAAVIVSMVSVFGGMVAYDPLRHIAEPRTQGDVVRWWPLLVYGPWMVASLSILRAALHQRRALHSWAVVLLFSTVAILLCVAQAPRTLTDAATAALPGLAALTCFQQIVRQITLTRPPRQATPRHRNTPPAASS